MASSFSSPWPDPNSPVLSKIDFGVPLVELFKWLDVRDTFLGNNFKKQDITAALALARDCKHLDAVWLSSMFEGKNASTKEDAREVFLSIENDARALCFAWWLTDDRVLDYSMLRRASEAGNAFACSTLCDQVFYGKEREEAFGLAQLASTQLERDGFYLLGLCLCEGRGGKKDFDLAKQNLLIAAELGDGWASDAYGRLLDGSDLSLWLWLGRAALRGYPDSFLSYFSEQVKQFCSGFGNASVVFLIGRALKGNIDLEKKEIFGTHVYFDSLIDPANQAVSFYDSQINSARLAVEAWTLIATRLHMIKDMRSSIGKMIWEARFEANYKV